VLMNEYALSENEAYARLRQSAMSRGLRMVDMAQSVLAVAGKG
jgi:AmiR/NasT family two-component response regulator